jgi:hypothetical protein
MSGNGKLRQSNTKKGSTKHNQALLVAASIFGILVGVTAAEAGINAYQAFQPRVAENEEQKIQDARKRKHLEQLKLEEKTKLEHQALEHLNKQKGPLTIEQQQKRELQLQVGPPTNVNRWAPTR